MSKEITTVLKILDKRGIQKAVFACQIARFMKVECSRSWKVQVYRWLAGDIRPREEVLVSIRKWIKAVS